MLPHEVQIAPAAVAQMDASRAVVRRAAEDHLPVYGINTGFGKLCEVRIAGDELARLQLNLVRSHACGLGAPLSEAETRVMWPCAPIRWHSATAACAPSLHRL